MTMTAFKIPVSIAKLIESSKIDCIYDQDRVVHRKRQTVCVCDLKLFQSICIRFHAILDHFYVEKQVGWLVDFGFNGPLRQYFSLYRAVSQREGDRGEKR